MADQTIHPLVRSSCADREKPGRWTVRVPRSWFAWAGPLGGLLNALTVQAAADLVDPDRVPRASNLQFLRTATDAPMTLQATVDRTGRVSDFCSVRGEQAGELVFLASVVYGRPAEGPSVQLVSAPVVPPASTCQEIVFPPDLVPFGQQFEIRHAAGGLPMTGSKQATMSAWLRRPGEPTDTLVAVVMMDAMPPGLYPTLTAPTAIVSAELSVHLHVDLDTHPVNEPVLAVQRTVASREGWCVDEGELWNPGGDLLAQSRQLRRILPRGHGASRG